MEGRNRPINRTSQLRCSGVRLCSLIAVKGLNHGYSAREPNFHTQRNQNGKTHSSWAIISGHIGRT